MSTSPKKDHERATPEVLPKTPIKPIPAIPVRVILLISVPISLLILIPVILAWILGK